MNPFKTLKASIINIGIGAAVFDETVRTTIFFGGIAQTLRVKKELELAFRYGFFHLFAKKKDEIKFKINLLFP